MGAPRKTRAARVGLPLLAVVLAALPAGAHQSDPNVFTLIDAVTPPLPGVVVQIRAGVADQLFLTNTTTTPVEVLDTRGKPFLSIGPYEVRADLSSPDWYTSNSPLGLAQSPPTDPSGWRVVARGSSWGWFDHRMHDRPAGRPPAARQVTKLNDWIVPLRHDGTEAQVKGHVEYRPVVGAFRTQVAKTPPDVSLDALDGRVPGLFLRWRGAGTLTVDGIDGEPFARFTSTGVEVNDASATWQEDQRLRGRTVRTPADATSPVWRAVGITPQLTWLDRRLAYAPGIPPGDALRSTRPTTVVEWDIAVDLAGVAGHLQGTTTWVPTAAQGNRDRAPWLPWALVLVVAAGGLVALRRRSER